jgi:hypothetical protein
MATSKKVASKAGSILRKRSTPKKMKSVAASDLEQARKRKRKKKSAAKRTNKR